LTPREGSVSVNVYGLSRGFAAGATPRSTKIRPRTGVALTNPIITLTTDYGNGDHLVGTLKGVILKINPDVTIVDITHDIAPFDLLDAAVTIAEASKYFPPRTIHVVIVDPGVGTERRPLLTRADTNYFVAPDNGVLSLIYDREESLTVRHITTEHYFLQPVSQTFHGRDIFAPVAAWLTKNWQPASMGDAITDFKRFNVPKPKQDGYVLKGVILRIDRFGNLMTNFTAADIPEEIFKSGKIQLLLNDKEVTRLVANFAQGQPNEPVAVIGSSGFLEVVVNKANASRVLNIGRGTPATLVLG